MNRDTFLALFNNPSVKANAGVDTAFQSYEWGMVLFAQAVHETGNFTSGVYQNGNNMFGMGKAQKRRKFWSGTAPNKEGSAMYDSVEMSMADRLNWDVYNRIVYVDVSQYIDHVLGQNDNGLKYATDPEYKKAWIRTINTVFDNAGMLRPYIRGYSEGTIAGGTGDKKDNGGTDPRYDETTGNTTEDTYYSFFDDSKIIGTTVLIAVVVFLGYMIAKE